TPNWIVQYLVQNSVGRLWLMANPGSTLKGAWRYYIEPAEQTPEVQAQLDALIQTRMAEDGGSLNPETITVLDPACGSGHILVEAYEVLKAIYLERGYQARAIPRLILEKNLFGLDIDDRAAQMAGFALMMKARADDRRLLDSPIKLNVLSLQESKGLELDEFDSHLKPFGISRALLAGLIDTFAHAKTFGSLIQIPAILDAGLHALADGIGKAMQSGDVFAQAAAQDLVPLVGQATVLAMKFDAVVANPPYMGSGYFDKTFKAGLSRNYKTKRSDLYAIFLERAFGFVGNSGLISMITRQDWMFTKSYAELRNYLCQTHTLGALAHLGAGAFEMLSGEVTQTAAFVLWKEQIPRYRILFVDCSRVKRDKESIFLTAERYARSFSNFPVRLEQPLLYHLVDEELNALACDESLSDVLTLREGIHSGDNTTFVRTWWEVSSGDTCVYAKSVDDLDKSGRRWVPYNKGGSTRKWYWGTDYVLRYDESSRKEMSSLSGHVRPSQNLYFSEGGTWSDVATKGFGVRFYPSGHLFADAGPVVIAKDIFSALGLMNSKPFVRLAQDVMPNLHFKCGTLQLMPYVVPALPEKSAKLAKQAVRVCMEIAATYEEQRTFEAHPLVSGTGSTLISKDFDSLLEKANQFNQSILDIETENNNAYALAFGLEKLTDWAATASDCYLFCPNRQSESSNFISYAIGCAMGRYSLDQPGLIYAHAGNVGFDVTRYKIFPADADGIVPITDELWFEDDATNRVREFVNAVWGAETIEENMDWLAESLGKKGTETPEETIRRYLSSSFYKDHLQTYKKRPIYWHFSSGKQGAFQALVYLHRYHEGTLARMRAEYVVPLTGKMQSRIEMLEKDRDAATSTAARSKLAKQIESLRKKHVELLAYDEKLRHYADMRITLDLDDGVKVNYGKFGDLLAEVKAVTGGVGED
ncbi:MAG: BREX-1 system adenine-specific DNA-methyltransferase PglX, partial [Azonexus sp.]